MLPQELSLTCEQRKYVDLSAAKVKHAITFFNHTKTIDAVTALFGENVKQQVIDDCLTLAKRFGSWSFCKACTDWRFGDAKEIQVDDKGLQKTFKPTISQLKQTCERLLKPYWLKQYKLEMLLKAKTYGSRQKTDISRRCELADALSKRVYAPLTQELVSGGIKSDADLLEGI